jgi:hypothetical protein
MTQSFYTETSLATWKKVLGLKMHYHFGSYSTEDIFDQTIRNLYQFIPNNSSILDIGCGWGGPATLLENEKACFVHGVTNSKQHYLHNSQTTFLTDAHDFIPSQDYDIAIFIESLTHLTTPSTVLANIKPYINKIVIRDYVAANDFYNDDWHMHFRSFQSFTDLISPHFSITHMKIDTETDVYNSAKFWYDNINQLQPNEYTTHIQHLKELSYSILQSPDTNLIKLITIVAE